ncbi:MAG: translocation/assembly module TamB domain-containing protein [Pseudomonadota bacterium]
MRFFWVLILVVFPALAAAQTADDSDEGFLVELIEENLSASGSTVNLVGFEGALSSEATITQLTVADSDGVWLTLDDVVLTWNRSALLRGAIDVEQISAARILVARAPMSEQTAPPAEATPFSLPELPVSITLGSLDIARIELGEVFLGEPVAFAVSGAAALADGQGNATVASTRLGNRQGQFSLSGSYDNATRALDLDLQLAEAANGIAARVLGLPGQPAVALDLAGAGTLSDFGADLRLATAGQERLSGRFDLAENESGQQINLDIGGDISPLFLPEYGAFFGDNVSLLATVTTDADGRVDIPELSLNADRIALEGAVAIGADGWPERIDITGGVADNTGDPVLLPLSGAPVLINGADLRVTYDVARGDDWRADVTVSALARDGVLIDQLSLQGGGVLRGGADVAQPLVTANVLYSATGLQMADTDAAAAFGDEISGRLQLERIGTGITRIQQITLTGAGINVDGSAAISGADAGFETTASIAVDVAGLNRFAGLAGQNIAGDAMLQVDAVLTPADGGFSVDLEGTLNDLQIGVPEADAVLEGAGRLRATVTRDQSGTTLRDLQVATAASEITAEATLTNETVNARFSADLRDVAIVVPTLRGPARLRGTVTQAAGGPLIYDISGSGPAANFSLEGNVEEGEGGQRIGFDLSTNLTDLSRYATLVGRPLSGAVVVATDGVVLVDGLRFDVDFDALTRDLQIGDSRIDPLLAGQGVLQGSFARTGFDRAQFNDLVLGTPLMSLTGQGDLDLSGSNAADLTLRLNDASVLDPALAGPLTAQITATPADDAATAAQISVTGPQTAISADIVVAGPDAGREITGEIAAQVADLSPFAGLTGMALAGSIDVTARGNVLPDLSRFDSQVNLRSEDLAIGNPTLDALLTGTGRINATIGQADGILSVRTLEVSTREVSIVAALNGAAGVGQGRFNASLRDVGVLTDQISGPIRARGSAALDDVGNWAVDATGTGPGGLQADVVGQLLATGNLAVDIDGSAPLALANTAIDPRRLLGLANFDVAVNGPPALTSLSGRVTFTDGRLAAPNLGEALTNIGGQITLGNARAQIDVRAGVESGGSVSLAGTVGLGGGNAADLTLRLDNVVVQDPDLFETSFDGAINITGPLQGGALVSGRINQGETNVQVPSSSISSLGDLPVVRHVGADADVRGTLQRAGVSVSGRDIAAEDGNGRSGPVYALDVVIDAPARIFIRGRGLDAELGGRLTIGGTSSNVIPVGQFSLVRGRIDILQQRFQLTEGVASLQGSFSPFIRLVATTETDTGTVINIIVEGPAGMPEVRFESVPELPQDEVLAQLIFGRDLESISPLQAVQLASAISTLAGRGGGALNDFRENIGLDDFDVTTDEEGTAAVRAGAYLSENVYTDVTVTSDGGTEINLNLDITSEITARGGVDQDGETSLGVFFERDY